MKHYRRTYPWSMLIWAWVTLSVAFGLVGIVIWWTWFA